MYHFADAHDVEHLPRPSWLLTLLEPVRLPAELSSSLAIDTVVPDSRRGSGRPVLVLPGFSADDLMTARLRGHLRKHGFAVHGWGLGRNHGLTDQLVDGLLERFDELYARHGVPVSVVGWSFGGLLARWLAHQRPDEVRQVVCLGSPWRAEGEITRTTPLFERAARRHGLSERARDIVAQLRGPLPVPLTVVWSRTDGIVNWRGCVVDAEAGGAPTDNIAVPSSHAGLPANPLSLAAVTDRLAQGDPWHPADFSWRTVLQSLVPGRRDAGSVL